MSAQTLNGEYNLHKHEMASGFRFTKDGKFEFYYVYGAVDRSATGTYSVVGDTLKIKSDKEPGKDFPVTKENHKGKGYTIQVTAPNDYLLRNIICFYFIGDVQNVAESDDKGVIHIDAPSVDKLYLQHQLFVDIASLIKDEKNTNNYFEVSLSPSLQFVSFAGIDFIIKGDELTCLPNYFMPMEDIRYTKE
ncbi:MAG TPA: hypothetical protein VFG10_14450 [Saprospiraceae bacterium]|nr:hypothetical protein [Saprospiraceae bacterium]